MRAVLRLFCCLLLVGLFSGCVLSVFRAHPTIKGRPLSDSELSTFFDSTALQSAQIKTFRGLSRSRFDVSGKKDGVRHVFVFARPGLLRVETFPLNSAFTLNLVSVSAGRVVVLDPSTKTAYSGEARKEILKKAIGLPLEVSDLMDFLVGRLPARVIDEKLSEVTLDEATQTYYLKVGDYREVYGLDAGTGLLKFAEIRDQFNDSLIFTAYYDKTDIVQGVNVPVDYRVELPAENTRMRFRLSSIALNGEPSPELFEPEIPSEYAREGL